MQVSTDWKINHSRPECELKQRGLGTTKTHLDLHLLGRLSFVFYLLHWKDMIVCLEGGLKNSGPWCVWGLLMLKAMIRTWDYGNSTRYTNISVTFHFYSETKHSICFQVVVGLPCFLFPGGDHQWPTLGIQSPSIRRTRLILSTTFGAICLLVQELVGNLFQPKHATYLTETPIVE